MFEAYSVSDNDATIVPQAKYVLYELNFSPQRKSSHMLLLCVNI